MAILYNKKIWVMNACHQYYPLAIISFIYLKYYSNYLISSDY